MNYPSAATRNFDLVNRRTHEHRTIIGRTLGEAFAKHGMKPFEWHLVYATATKGEE